MTLTIQKTDRQANRQAKSHFNSVAYLVPGGPDSPDGGKIAASFDTLAHGKRTVPGTDFQWIYIIVRTVRSVREPILLGFSHDGSDGPDGLSPSIPSSRRDVLLLWGWSPMRAIGPKGCGLGRQKERVVMPASQAGRRTHGANASIA
jgi:hypothetical protein